MMLRDLLGVLFFVAAVCKLGGNKREVQSFIFQGENSRYAVNWLYLAMALLKALF
jgi:hypothetical protein